MQHLHDMYQQPFGIDPVYEEESVVFITSENAETYAPVRITVAYGGQIPVPKGTSNSGVLSACCRTLRDYLPTPGELRNSQCLPGLLRTSEKSCRMHAQILSLVGQSAI
jgi:hypothetical protein